MLGAIIGDIAGSKYEFNNYKNENVELLTKGCFFTDDTVCTIANMDWLLHAKERNAETATEYLRKWTRKYPNAGYGGRFMNWVLSLEPKPYGSFGNGSAMRVSAAGWLYDTLEETLHAARLTAEVTHNHPEGIKGAEATAAAIFMARTGKSKDEIRDYIVSEFGYDLSRTIDEIRPSYHHVESCQETVPEAITAFLEGESFEDVIRTAVSLGGDCDTLTCIAGSIAEAFYGVPEDLKDECFLRIMPEMQEVLARLDEMRK